MPVRRAAPYHSVVLRAVLGLAQARNPSIKANISKNGHTLILYNVSENDIDLIEIPTPDGKSYQNVHFISIYPYFENESVSNPIRVYGLHDIVGQTYRQEEANAYSKLTTEATFRPFSKLGIPSLTDKLSIIGSSVGVSENTKGKKKLFVIVLGNDSSNDSDLEGSLIAAGVTSAIGGGIYYVVNNPAKIGSTPYMASDGSPLNYPASYYEEDPEDVIAEEAGLNAGEDAAIDTTADVIADTAVEVGVDSLAVADL